MPAAPLSASGLLLHLLPLLLLRSLHTCAGSEVPAPQNLRMVSLNTNYTLTWDWDQDRDQDQVQSAAGGEDVTFTTQYTSKYLMKSIRGPRWHTACEDSRRRSCDLTRFNLFYLGKYALRVRAGVNGSHSDWIHTEFFPDEEAALGPPTTVNVSRFGDALDVSILPPLTSSNSSMKELIPLLYYHIVYWEHAPGQQPCCRQNVSSTVTLVSLPDLKPWTWYCVSVQSRYEFYRKSSNFTAPICVQTEGATPWWLILLCFLGSLLLWFTLMLICVFGVFRTYKTIKTTFYPSNQLPPHFREYFCDSPSSDIPRLLTPDSESELLCDKVIVSPEPVLEIHHPPPEALPDPPLNMEADSSGRHSRQDSRGSRDSGVYSTEGSSGPRRLHSNQSSTGGESSWQGSFDPEQVKMQDMAPGLKSPPAMADEGIVDVCV